MEKIVRDGEDGTVEVAVAVSFGFGAGWSTWNAVDPMDARFNQLFLDGKHSEAEVLCKQLDLGYGGGAEDVEIVWLEQGTEFIIDEYDGAEGLQLKDDTKWRTA